jgi:hypothetical protein
LRTSALQDGRLDYMSPKVGDYHDRALEQRLGLLQEVCKPPFAAGNWVATYINRLKRADGKGAELVVSKSGRARPCA